MNVAVIPARGGSKRIVRKNVREFAGRPMIAWPISVALESGLFDRVIVSTDDDEIAEVARASGAEVPFKRSAELADDHATTLDAIGHAADWIVQAGWKPQYLCCIYATAPLLRAADLRNGYETLSQGKWNYVVSAARFSFPIQRAMKRLSDGSVQFFQPEHRLTRSQDLEPAYHDAGQFYWGRISAWTGREPIFGLSTAIVTLPPWRVHDIDTPEDWQMATHLFEMIGRNSNG